MGYRASVLHAYQRADTINKVSIAMDMLLYVTQAIALLKFRNYYLYAGMLVLRSIAFNLIIWFITRRSFSGIRPVGRITRQERDLILRKTGALVGHKIGTVVVNSVDNILISAYIGLNVVAVYNNYFYVLTAVSGLFLMLTNGLTSIIGNYIIKKGSIRDRRIVSRYAFFYCPRCLLQLHMLAEYVSAVYFGLDGRRFVASVQFGYPVYRIFLYRKD